MKSLPLVLPVFLLLCGWTASAQEHAISIAEYNGDSKQQVFLQTPFSDEIYNIMQKHYNRGHRIITTGNQYSPTLQRQCWYFTVSKEKARTDQRFIVEDEGFPSEFIRQGWAEGYAITSLSCNRSLYWVVMTQGTDFSDQDITFSDASGLQEEILKQQSSGRSVTNLFYNGEQWGAVFSKDPSQSGQRLCFVDQASAAERINQRRNEGRRIQNLTLGEGMVAFTDVEMPKDKAILQNICISDENFEKHITDLIKKGYVIQSLGGDLDAGGRMPFIREMEENIEKQDKIARRDERLDKVSKILDVANAVLEGINVALGEDAPTSDLSSDSISQQEDMINIDQKIQQLRQEAASMRNGAFRGKVPGITNSQEQAAADKAAAEWERRIAYLQNLRAQGVTEIPVSQWNAYTRGRRDSERQAHQREMNRVKDEGEQRVSFWRNQNYSAYENQLRDMKDHPEKYMSEGMSGYRRDVQAIQDKMRQLRQEHYKKYGREVIKASEWETWNP